MTKEITKANILQQLQDKFKLRELIPERFTFSEQVLPIYNIEPEVEYNVADFETVSVNGAPLPYLFFTVPETQRWHLNRYGVTFMAAGAYTITGVFIRRIHELASAAIYLDMTEGQTISYAHDLPKPVRLDPGDKIYVYADGYTSTADLRLYIDYLMEEIR